MNFGPIDGNPQSGDDSLDAEDMERLKRAREHAADVLRDVEEAPSKGPLKRDLNDNESILAWAVEYQAEVIEGMKGVLKALGNTPSQSRPMEFPMGDPHPCDMTPEERERFFAPSSTQRIDVIAEYHRLLVREWEQAYGRPCSVPLPNDAEKAALLELAERLAPMNIASAIVYEHIGRMEVEPNYTGLFSKNDDGEFPIGVYAIFRRADSRGVQK